jgi:hypothetical protein
VGNIFRYIVIIIAFIFLTSCAKRGSKDFINSKDNLQEIKCDSMVNLCDKCLNKHDINNPDYVPPCDGGINGKWCNNRHKMLTNENNCYFRRGNEKK